jgi:hypothetical protein
MMKAFPRQITFVNGVSEGKWIDDGMDLRDYFAAKAMQGLITIVKGCELGRDGTTIMPDSIRLSNVAYGVADAMMKAREAHG